MDLVMANQVNLVPNPREAKTNPLKNAIIKLFSISLLF